MPSTGRQVGGGVQQGLAGREVGEGGRLKRFLGCLLEVLEWRCGWESDEVGVKMSFGSLLQLQEWPVGWRAGGSGLSAPSTVVGVGVVGTRRAQEDGMEMHLHHLFSGVEVDSGEEK